MPQCQKVLSADFEVQHLLMISLRMTVEQTESVFLSLTETAVVSWQLLSLVTDCARLKLLSLETPSGWPVVERRVVDTCAVHRVQTTACRHVGSELKAVG